MKTLKEITGSDILNSYETVTGDTFKTTNDREHFTMVFEQWRIKLIDECENHLPTDVSLNRTNFKGKKTRALLHAMQMPEPKTLGLLIGQLWAMHDDTVLYNSVTT